MADVYKIGVSLAMQSNAPAFFSALSRQILGVHAQVGQLQGGLTQLSRMKLAIGGGLALVGGTATLSMLGKIIDKGAELQRVQNNFRLAGESEQAIAAATAKSWELTAKYRTLGVARIGDMINETRSVYNSTAVAMANIEPALKAATVLKSTMKGKDQEGIVGQVFDMFKTADLRNITDDPKATEKFFDQMTKVVTATGGRVTPKDFLQATKYSKSAGQTWTDAFIAGPLASMMQEGSASTVGTALASMDQSVVGGKTTLQSNKLYSDLGLIKKGAAIFGNKGNIKDIQAGGIEGGGLFRLDPYEWTQNVLKPRIIAMLMRQNGGKLLNEDQVAAGSIPILSGLYGNRNAEWIANTMFKQRPIERDIEQQRQAQGLEGAKTLLDKDWYTAVQSFTTQWDNLMTALGAPGVGTATKALNSITSVISDMAQYAAKPENAGAIEAIGKGIAILGVSLVGAGGTALLAALGPAGWLVLGIGAAAAAAETVKPGYLATLKDDWLAWVKAIGSADIKGILTGSLKGMNDMLFGLPLEMAKVVKDIGVAVGKELSPIVSYLSDEIKTWPGRLTESIKSFGIAITTKLQEVFSSLNPLNWFGKASPTSFEGGGFGGATIQKASLGDAANDNGGVAGRLAGSGGGGGPLPGISSAIPMSESERNTLGLILKYESHGQNTMNYMGKRLGLSPSTAKGYTAQGYFQMLNSNWRRIAPGLGITAPNAMAGSLEDQTRVALHLLRNGGIQNWSNYNPALRNALRRGERAPSGAPTPAPPVGAPPKRKEQDTITNVHLDGKVIARAVTQRMASAGKYPRHTGGMDTQGTWRPPGTTLTDAA